MPWDITPASSKAPSRRQLPQYATYLTIICAGLALVSDAYQGGLLSIMNVNFKAQFGDQYTSSVRLRLANALNLGVIFGQLTLGVLLDNFGRQSGLFLTTANVVTGSIIGAASQGARGSLDGLFWCLTIARVIVGFGIGGEIPASSVAAIEALADHDDTQEHKFLNYITVTTFASVIGTPLLCLVFLITMRCTRSLDVIWRIAVAFGGLLPLLLFLFRVITRDSVIWSFSRRYVRRPPLKLIFNLYGVRLFGISIVYFIHDFTQIPLAIFAGTMVADIVEETGFTRLRKTVIWQLILSIVAMPGTVLSVVIAERWGKRNTIILGFAAYFMFGMTIGYRYEELQKYVGLFVTLYGLMQGAGTMGAGTILGTITADAFPKGTRGTMYGLAGAFGRGGAVLGLLCYNPIIQKLGQKYAFVISGLVGGLGGVAAYFLLNNESLSYREESDRFQLFLVRSDWPHPLHGREFHELSVSTSLSHGLPSATTVRI